MANYLIATWDGGGTTPPVMSVTRALTSKGHDVRVMADPVLRPDVEAAGATHVSWTRAPHRSTHTVESDFIKDWEPRSPAGGIARMIERLMFGPAAAFAADVTEEIERRRPDVLVSEVLIAGPQVAAEAAGVPRAVLVPTVNMLPTPGVPPFGPGFKPATGALGRARDRALGAMNARTFAKGLPGLNAARAEYGLRPVDDPLAQIVDADRVLVLTSAAFDWAAPELPAAVRYVGPRLDDPDWTGDWEPPAGEEPLVLVGLSSTYQKQGSLLRRATEALGTLPVRGLVTTGPAISADDLPAPANVHVRESAPHARILPSTGALVTHCGHGTAIKALAHGVPMVCMPMGRDQNEVATRVVAAGAGKKVRSGASPQAIARAVQEVLADGSYRAAAGRLAEAIREETAQDRALAELEGLANGVASQREPVGA